MPQRARQRLRCGWVRPPLASADTAPDKAPEPGAVGGTFHRGELLAAVDESAGLLHRQMEWHRALVTAALKTCIDPESLELALANCPRRCREERFKAAIQEAIEVLDASRRAFKSKQLEALRKHLTQVLIDTR